MSIRLEIACDKCGRPSGRLFPHQNGIHAFRALLASFGWRAVWTGDPVQAATDRCPGCAS